jgi:hypothetical protein
MNKLLIIGLFSIFFLFFLVDSVVAVTDTIGDNSSSAYTYTGGGSAFPMTASSSGTLNTIGINVNYDSGGNAIRLAIYHNAGTKPDTLLCESGSTLVNETGWNDLDVSSCALSISASTTYWLAVQQSSNNVQFYYLTSGSRSYENSHAYGSFCTQWGCGSGSTEDSGLTVNMRMDYTAVTTTTTTSTTTTTTATTPIPPPINTTNILHVPLNFYGKTIDYFDILNCGHVYQNNTYYQLTGNMNNTGAGYQCVNQNSLYNTTFDLMGYTIQSQAGNIFNLYGDNIAIINGTLYTTTYGGSSTMRLLSNEPQGKPHYTIYKILIVNSVGNGIDLETSGIIADSQIYSSALTPSDSLSVSTGLNSIFVNSSFESGGNGIGIYLYTTSLSKIVNIFANSIDLRGSYSSLTGSNYICNTDTLPVNNVHNLNVPLNFTFNNTYLNSTQSNSTNCFKIEYGIETPTLSSYIPVILRGACVQGYKDTTGTLTNFNTTYSCQTTPIDTSQCSNITTVLGNQKLYFMPKNLTCPNTSYNISTAFAFNNSNVFSNSNSNACIDYFYYNNPRYADFSSNLNQYYLNKTKVFGTCYYYNNNTNNILASMYCDLKVTCQLFANVSCTQRCVNGVLYLNGTRDSQTGECSFPLPLNTVQCANAYCSSPTTCGTANIIGNFGESPIIKGIPIVSLFFTQGGLALIGLFGIESAFLYFGGSSGSSFSDSIEDIVIIIFIIGNVILSLIGWFGINGYMMALLGFFIFMIDFKSDKK